MLRGALSPNYHFFLGARSSQDQCPARANFTILYEGC